MEWEDDILGVSDENSLPQLEKQPNGSVYTAQLLCFMFIGLFKIIT